MHRIATTCVIAAALLCCVPPPLLAQTISEQYLFAAANRDRAAMNLPPLHLDDHLALAARLHAAEMASRRTISHQFPGEADLAKRAADSGAHFSLITENVAEASNSALIHDLWMNSAGHRANLLDPARSTRSASPSCRTAGNSTRSKTSPAASASLRSTSRSQPLLPCSSSASGLKLANGKLAPMPASPAPCRLVSWVRASPDS